jgi:hypothetical protein
VASPPPELSAAELEEAIAAELFQPAAGAPVPPTDAPQDTDGAPVPPKGRPTTKAACQEPAAASAAVPAGGSAEPPQTLTPAVAKIAFPKPPAKNPKARRTG